MPDGKCRDLLDRISPGAVAAGVIGWVVALSVLRLALSPFLEIDEAQFVGAVDLRMVYGNSHPPLYNWLVRGALELTGWRWPPALALVRAVLLAATLLLVYDAGRRIGGRPAGLVALAAATLMPQISWMSAHTLAHSLLAMAGAAAVLHAVTIIVRTPAPLAFVWLGVAAAVGVLGKFNVALLLVPLAIAVAREPVLRSRFVRPSALLAPATFAALAGPALVAAVWQPRMSSERLAKLYEEGPFTAIDVPVLGLDGVLSLALSAVASAGVVLVLIAAFGRTVPPALGPTALAVRRALWVTLALGLAGFALGALASDLSLVHERYLTPLLMTVPLLAGMHLSASRHRARIIAAGVVVLLVVPFGIAGMVAFDGHRFARPYDALALPLAAALPQGPVTVIAPAPDLAANLTLALRRMGIHAAVEGDRMSGVTEARTVVRVRSGIGPFRGDPPVAVARLCERATVRAEAPLRNLTGRTLAITAIIYAACP